MTPNFLTQSGQTRTAFHRDHALIAPDGHVPTPIPSWNGARGVVLISPAMGARFAQTLVFLEPGPDVAFRPASNIEALIYVLEGELEGGGALLSAGSYIYLPPEEAIQFSMQTAARLVVFEKRYAPCKARKGYGPLKRIIAHQLDVPSQPFLGDPDAQLQILLPENLGFDLAVNIFTYQPGATLPFVETHVMEHGLWMLDGMGIYRLNEHWYPVASGDCIWMAPYCPQWFAATGKTPARYLYYKDVNRDAMENL